MYFNVLVPWLFAASYVLIAELNCLALAGTCIFVGLGHFFA